jgi:hypothetical protein
MRKIEKAMVNAINNQQNWQLDNTMVRKIDDTNMGVYLFGNHIADVNSSTGFVLVNVNTLKVHPTPTTKSRLRALGANVWTKNGVTFLDGIQVA